MRKTLKYSFLIYNVTPLPWSSQLMLGKHIIFLNPNSTFLTFFRNFEIRLRNLGYNDKIKITYLFYILILPLAFAC